MPPSSVVHSKSGSVLPAFATLTNANPLELAGLSRMMQLTGGRPEVAIGLIDGPVSISHPDLAAANIREIPGTLAGSCTRATSTACMHGTFVAGILSARRGCPAPSIAPDCILLVRPIFSESTSGNPEMPGATPEELATAIVDCVDAGANVINLSAALAQPSTKGKRRLEEALDYCSHRGSVVVAAAGNQGSIGSSPITRHPWVIPVVACDLQGRPIGYSNFGNSIGRRGLSAPGDRITSLGASGNSLTFGGTSAATPFVTGAVALLKSIFPEATAGDLKIAVTRSHVMRRPSLIPPLLDAWAAYEFMASTYSARQAS